MLYAEDDCAQVYQCTPASVKVIQWHPWSQLLNDGVGLAFVAYTVLAVCMATLAAIMVYTLAPYASGSGIPEVCSLSATTSETERL
jgi:H+/Cl- antiporter ClcA